MKEGIYTIIVMTTIITVALVAQDPVAKDTTVSRVEWLKKIEKQIETVDNEINSAVQRTAELRAYRTYLEGQRQLLSGMRDSVLTVPKEKK